LLGSSGKDGGLES